MKNVLRGAMIAALIALVSWPQNAHADQPGAPTQVAAPGSAAPGTGEHAAEADALFQHGVALMKADNCSDAVPELLKSNALDPSAATLLNLGTCYARLGRKATAWKTYQKAADAAQREQDDPLRERALQAMSILGPTLTKVQIVAPKSSAPLSLRLNGEALVNYDGLPIPLDPGESVIEAAAPGHEPWRHRVTADDVGATLVVQVPELATVRPQPQPYMATERNNSEQRPDWRVPGAIVGGLGVASVLVGAVFGLSAAQSYDDSQTYCAGNRCTQPGVDLRDRASTKAAVSTWTISLGLVATATGAVLWLMSPTHASPPPRAAFVATPMNGSEFVMLVNERR